jgi:hypothetical protein
MAEGSKDSDGTVPGFLAPNCTGLHTGAEDRLSAIWILRRRTVLGDPLAADDAEILRALAKSHGEESVDGSDDNDGSADRQQGC